MRTHQPHLDLVAFLNAEFFHEVLGEFDGETAIRLPDLHTHMIHYFGISDAGTRTYLTRLRCHV